MYGVRRNLRWLSTNQYVDDQLKPLMVCHLNIELQNEGKYRHAKESMTVVYSPKWNSGWCTCRCTAQAWIYFCLILYTRESKLLLLQSYSRFLIRQPAESKWQWKRYMVNLSPLTFLTIFTHRRFNAGRHNYVLPRLRCAKFKSP